MDHPSHRTQAFSEKKPPLVPTKHRRIPAGIKTRAPHRWREWIAVDQRQNRTGILRRTAPTATAAGPTWTRPLVPSSLLFLRLSNQHQRAARAKMSRTFPWARTGHGQFYLDEKKPPGRQRFVHRALRPRGTDFSYFARTCRAPARRRHDFGKRAQSPPTAGRTARRGGGRAHRRKARDPS